MLLLDDALDALREKHEDEGARRSRSIESMLKVCGACGLCSSWGSIAVDGRGHVKLIEE